MVEPVKYDSNLSLEEAIERYREVESEFARIKRNYSGLRRLFTRNIGKEDLDDLSSFFGVLLPLSHMDSVQKQILEEKTIKGTLFEKISEMQYEILEYLASFKNTGVERIPPLHATN